MLGATGAAAHLLELDEAVAVQAGEVLAHGAGGDAELDRHVLGSHAALLLQGHEDAPPAADDRIDACGHGRQSTGPARFTQKHLAKLAGPS